MAIHGVYSHDVFVSYRGSDTKNFTGHLINSLRLRGLNVFKDDEFQRGESISSALVAAIEGSKLSIVVFSKNYAESRWCLDELVKILECKELRRQFVRVIFYQIDPSDVRNQRGSYGTAMDDHKKGNNSIKVDSWETALKDAANLGGWPFVDGYEPDFIQRITEEVSGQLASLAFLYVARHPVGLESRIAELNSFLNIEDKDDVRVVAVCGPEGVGKTTIAKAVYNSIAHQFEGRSFLQFEGRSFLQDVGEYSKFELIRLQEVLLSEILREKNLMVGSVDRGINIIQERLCTKRVLLVLDNVNVLDQVYHLAGEPIRFGKGSRIIITTRNKQLIKPLEIPTTIYEVKNLNYQQALELLCLYAFKNKVAPNDYAEVAKRVVDYSQGFPPKLVELGLRLYGKDADEWATELQSLHGDHYNGPSASDGTEVELLGQETRSLGLNESLDANPLVLQPSDNHPSFVTFEMQEGIYVEHGNGSESLKREKWKGTRSFMMRTTGHSIVRGSEPTFWRSLPDSRAFEDAELNYVYSLDIKGKIDSNTSQKAIYGAYLIFKLISPQKSFEMKPIDLSVKLEGDQDLNDENEFVVRLSNAQGDGWMEIEIGEFFNGDIEDGSAVCTNVEIDSNVTKAGLVVQGIEIRRKDRTGSETDSTSLSSLDDRRSFSLGSSTSESTDVTSDRFLSLDNPDADMESELLSSAFFNYDHTRLIENGNLRVTEDKSSGKICCLVSARGLIISWSDQPTYWSWTSIPHSRFPLVAKLNIVHWLNIEGMIETQCLSPGTTYAAYFLFKLQGLVSGFREQPLKVSVDCEGEESVEERSVFLDPPEIEARPYRKREDGWMEINMGEFFINGDDSGKIKCSLKEHTASVRKTGLIVEGIEFRPMVC